MSWITIVWSMMTSACLTVAIMHVAIWIRQTGQWAHLLLSVTAASVAVIAGCELLAMYAQNPEQYGRIMWWGHIPVFTTVVSMAGFVGLYFNAGRRWLAYTACGLRLLDLILNFFAAPNLNYTQIIGLRHLTILGQTISIAKGVENPWIKISELSSLFLLIFITDASIMLWRRGTRVERRRALIVGGSMVFFILVAGGTSALIEAGIMRSPYLISCSFLAIVVAMGYELSSDVVRSARLVRRLQASEAASRESEERFRILADTAPVMIWMSGTDKLCSFFNKQWLEFTGRTMGQELGNGWSEGIHADDFKRCLETYISCFGARKSFTMEYRLRRADGEYRWILDTGVPRYVAKGEFAGYIGSAIDITERRLAEAALRESEQHMSLAASAGELAMWMWDIPRDEVWITDKGRELFGFAPKEKISFERFLKVLHPEDREMVRQARAKALNGAGEYETEYRVVLSAEKVRWIGGRGRAEFQGDKPVRMRGVSLDITLRKQAEERFRLVVEAAPNAMIMVNAEGKIDLINAEVESVFGYTRQELIGRSVEILIPERFRSEHPSHRREYFAEPRVRAMGAGRELFGRRKDGTKVPIEIGLSPLHTSAGLFVLASIVDISERRQTELESARQRNELAHLSRVGLLGELSVSLAHELNQPLTAILSNTQAAQLLLAEGAADPDELPQILSEIVQESKRAGEVIRRLRALLRKGEIHRVPLDVNQVVENVVKLMRSDLINQHVTIDVELAANLPLVEGDEVQLQQVLLNLVVNACDAMAQVEVLNRRLFISTELAGSKGVRVSVVDHGRGIPPERVERIFEPFFTTKETGIGLGLAVCRTIITAHGGKLWAVNNPEHGATVQFTLPAMAHGE